MAALASQTPLAGFAGLSHYERCLARRWRGSGEAGPARGRARWLSVVLPLAAFLAFGMLFILANPDLLTAFGESVQQFLLAVRQWMVWFSPSLPEALLWVAALWIAVGLLRPAVGRRLFEEPAGGDAAL